MGIKNIVKLVVINAFVLMGILGFRSDDAYAADKVVVWALNPQDIIYEAPLSAVIETHVPEVTRQMFNEHDGEVVIAPNSLGIAGRTFNIFDSMGRATFDTKCYMEISPSYGFNQMDSCVLHEFGHVLDMGTYVTYDPNLSKLISAEIASYNSLASSLGEMIPYYYDAHELFAQIHSAVLGSDGTTLYANEMMAACPMTTRIIKQAYGMV